jgi:hypothetical protein
VLARTYHFESKFHCIKAKVTIVRERKIKYEKHDPPSFFFTTKRNILPCKKRIAGSKQKISSPLQNSTEHEEFIGVIINL